MKHPVLNRTYLCLLWFACVAHVSVWRLERRAARGLDIRGEADHLEQRLAEAQARVQRAIDATN